MNMRRDPITTGNIDCFGYNEPSQTLEVEFKTGGVYQYYKVTYTLFRQFMDSANKGDFLYYHIRNVLPYSRVEYRESKSSFNGIVTIDGNMFCAKRHDFENLQESNAGFGETRELAIKDLEERENA